MRTDLRTVQQYSRTTINWTAYKYGFPGALWTRVLRFYNLSPKVINRNLLPFGLLTADGAMDHFNERIRSMFEMFGQSMFGKRKKITDGGKTKQTKQPSKTKVHCGGSKTTGKTNQGTATALTASKTSFVGKARSRGTQRSKEKNCSTSTSNSSSKTSGVFASRLMHLATTSLPSDGNDRDQHWLSIKTMAGNGFHCAVYLLHCAQHNKVAVTKPSAHQAMWMPFTPIPPNRSWEETGLAGLLIILSGANVDLFLSLKEQLPYAERALIEVYDVQLPHTLDIITRLTWYVRLDQRLVKSAHFKCCQDTETLIWIDAEDIAEQKPAVLEYLWGNELMEMAAVVATCYKEKQSLCTTFEEYSLAMAYKYVPHNPPADNEQQLLYSACLSEKDIERLYGDFLDHCHPCNAMAVHSFKVYMTKYGLKYADERLWAYFRAFNLNNNGVITFPELLLGLACIDSKSMHNETRAKFILRYYDVFRHGHLTEDDVRLMIQDIHAGENITEETVEANLAAVLQEVETEEDPQTGRTIIQQRRFLAAIGNHKIRGTSKLCRIGKPICAAISSAIFARVQRNLKQNQQIGNVIDRPINGTCIGCRAKRPVLDEHLAKITADGYLAEQVNVDGLKQLEGKSANATLTKSRERQSRQRQKSNQRKPSADKSNKKKTTSSSSATSLNQCASLSSVEGIASQESLISNQQNEEAQAAAFSLIKMIREFVHNKGDTRNPMGLLAQSDGERRHFFAQLELLERALGPMLKRRRWVPVPSPAYIIGDIHGNLDDLLTLEQSLWKRFPLVGPNLVFLGDMVDRGKWSIECATYILCLSVLAPNKVTLLRGNHEVRSLQCHYTYQAECICKYGNELGFKIWELTNRIFDILPLCAVVDGAVYCAHGGIPRTTITLADVAALPVELADPQNESLVAWEILWSDPMAQQQFVEMARILQVDLANCEGFLPNQKRGTAWAFNEEAINRFFAANGLSHVVRAHEVPSNGFFFHFDKKCATIFSCSHYCGNGNDCAVLFVDRDQLRMVRIDTSNNASATD